MLLCMIPSMAFAESTQSEMSWAKASYSSQINKLSGIYLNNVEDANNCEIKFSSSNQDVIPDDLIVYEVKKESSVYVNFISISAGETDITATAKSKDGSEATATMSVTVKATVGKASDNISVDVGKSISFEEACGETLSKYVMQHPELKLVLDSDTVTQYADVDTDKRTVTGKKGGIELISMRYEKYPSLKWSIKLSCNDSGIYYGGEYGNRYDSGEKINDSLKWDVGKKGTKNIQLKAYTVSSDLMYDTNAIYVSSNTDVATISQNEKGLVTVQKNGTARIDVYEGTITSKHKIGSATIIVTGCEETSDPDSGWVAVPEGEFTGTGEDLTKVSLGNHKFEKQSFNDANIEASVSQEIKSGDVRFDIRVSTSNAKGYTVSDELLAEWMAEMLKRTNICDVAEDGATGDIVAAYGDGYTSEPSSWTHDGSGSVNNGSVLTYSINVDKDRLKKGRKYQLVLGSELYAYVNKLDLDKLKNSNVGESSVTDTIGGKDAIFTFLTVSPAKNVVLDQSELTMKPGGKAVLVATMNDGLTTQYDDSIAWSSSNESVVTVDDNGSITALKPGTAEIRATAVDGKVEAKCSVTVSPVAASKITLSAKKVKLAAGQSKTVKATVAPADTTDKTVKWATSSRKVATVSSKGTIKAVAPGKTTITAKTTNGKTAKVTVRVSPVKTSISVKAGKKSATVKYKKVKGATRYQVYRATSKNGTYKRIVTRNASKCGTYKDTKLKGKKTYWYKVRSYKLVGNEKIYSDFSAPKKVTTKR